MTVKDLTYHLSFIDPTQEIYVTDEGILHVADHNGDKYRIRDFGDGLHASPVTEESNLVYLKDYKRKI